MAATEAESWTAIEEWQDTTGGLFDLQREAKGRIAPHLLFRARCTRQDDSIRYFDAGDRVGALAKAAEFCRQDLAEYVKLNAGKETAK